MRSWWTVAIAALVVAGLVAAEKKAAVVDKVETETGEAEIDWTNHVISVVGIGPPQEAQGIPARRLKAMQRRVAIGDAYRMLGETIQGVHVTSETTIHNYQLVSDDIKLKMEAFIKGQRIVEETTDDDGNYLVTIQAALFGRAGSVAAVVLPALADLEEQAIEQRQEEDREAERDPVPALDIPAKPPAPPTPVPDRKPGPYSGLVIDARGFDLERAMAPKIVTEDGSEVWGTVQVDREFVLNTGIVGFVLNLEAPNRAGDNPLVLRAIGRHGSFRADPVISDEEAELLMKENSKTKFLDKFKVVFVVD